MSISVSLVNKPNLNICFAFRCGAHNFTNLIQKVAKYELNIGKTAPHHQNGWQTSLSLQTSLMSEYYRSSFDRGTKIFRVFGHNVGVSMDRIIDKRYVD